MRRDNDHAAQIIHKENAERMLLASFVADLMGNWEINKDPKSTKFGPSFEQSSRS
jgi:hypothetical protein